MTAETNRPYGDFLRTAFHEAGHAVLSEAQDLPLAHATIIPNHGRGYWGRVLSMDDDGRCCDAGGADVDHSRDRAIELLAGFAAEVEFCGANPLEPSPSSEGDFQDAADLIDKNHLEPMETLHREARRLLRDRRAAVLRVTWALLHFGTVSETTISGPPPRLVGARSAVPEV